MPRQLQDVKIKLVVETSEATFTREFELSEYGHIIDMLDDLMEEVNRRTGTALVIQ